MGLEIRNSRGYGWVPDLPDHRDRLFAAEPEFLAAAATTPHFDLTHDPDMPPVWDQGQIGSCQAHSTGAAFAFAHKKAGHTTLKPSRLWIYYQARLIEGTVASDAGSSIRDGFKVISSVGVPHETKWPYDIARFAEAPPALAASDALKHEATVYRSLPNDLTALKSALLSGYPISFGFSVYESFESAEVAQTGRVPMPAPHEPCLGGHAVLIVGYDEPSQMFIVRNSWGNRWGLNGYFLMPYSYVLSASLASDFWQVTVAS